MLPWHTNTYSPPDHFLEALRRYDSNLQILWNAVSKKWDLYRKGREGQVDYKAGRILSAKSGELDGRIIDRLIEGDLWKYKNSREFLRYVDNHNDSIKENLRRRFHESNLEAGEKAWRKTRATKDVWGWTPATEEKYKEVTC